MLAAGVAVWRAWRAAGGAEPAVVTGHSLGEYTALVCAGGLGFAEAVSLVADRGRFMQEAVSEGQGAMAAILGLDDGAVAEVCARAAQGQVVAPANFNSPGQIVISGSVKGVRRVMELAKDAGAKMAKELVVSGAFHSPLMESAGEGLFRALQEVDFRDARRPVYTNVSAGPVTRSAEIRQLLHRQLTSPVRWEESVRAMARDGADTFCEVGPGKVLQGLVKRTAPSARTAGFDTMADLP
jgi:[acyl-carrier-protein] S-malonyltransferase